MNQDFIDTFFRYVVAVDMRQNSVLKNKLRHTKNQRSSVIHKLIFVLQK